MNFTFHPDEAGWIGRKRVFYPILGADRWEGETDVEQLRVGGLIGKYSAVKGKEGMDLLIFSEASLYFRVFVFGGG